MNRTLENRRTDMKLFLKKTNTCTLGDLPPLTKKYHFSYVRKDI